MNEFCLKGRAVEMSFTMDGDMRDAKATLGNQVNTN